MTIRSEPIRPDSQLPSPKNNENELVVPPIKHQQDKNERATNCIALIANAEERNLVLLRNRQQQSQEELKVPQKENQLRPGSFSRDLDDLDEELKKEDSTDFQNVLNPNQEEDIDDLFIHNKTNGNQLLFFPGMPL